MLSDSGCGIFGEQQRRDQLGIDAFPRSVQIEFAYRLVSEVGGRSHNEMIEMPDLLENAAHIVLAGDICRDCLHTLRLQLRGYQCESLRRATHDKDLCLFSECSACDRETHARASSDDNDFLIGDVHKKPYPSFMFGNKKPFVERLSTKRPCEPKFIAWVHLIDE